MNKIKFAKVRPTAKIPNKRTEDAGYDIYADFEDDFIKVEPHTTVMIPTGIASACEPDLCFVLKERGSTGSKGIAQRCGVIDSGYRGEWFVPITNTNNIPLLICKNKFVNKISKTTKFNSMIYPYEKAICQALILPVFENEIEEVSFEELQNIKSERRNGALGSSEK